MPENPLPASLVRLPDGTVQQAAPAQVHLHQDQVVHHHYPEAPTPTGTAVAVAIAETLGRGATGCGVAIGAGAVLLIGGSIITAIVQSLAVGAISVAVAAIAIACAARWMQQAHADYRTSKAKRH